MVCWDSRGVGGAYSASRGETRKKRTLQTYTVLWTMKTWYKSRYESVRRKRLNSVSNTSPPRSAVLPTPTSTNTSRLGRAVPTRYSSPQKLLSTIDFFQMSEQSRIDILYSSTQTLLKSNSGLPTRGARAAVGSYLVPPRSTAAPCAVFLLYQVWS